MSILFTSAAVVFCVSWCAGACVVRRSIYDVILKSVACSPIQAWPSITGINCRNYKLLVNSNFNSEWLTATFLLLKKWKDTVSIKSRENCRCDIQIHNSIILNIAAFLDWICSPLPQIYKVGKESLQVEYYQVLPSMPPSSHVMAHVYSCC